MGELLSLFANLLDAKAHHILKWEVMPEINIGHLLVGTAISAAIGTIAGLAAVAIASRFLQPEHCRKPPAVPLKLSTAAATGILKDQVVVVTGTAFGIGKAIAARCAAEGATVVLADLEEHSERVTRDAAALQKTHGIVAAFLACDVRSEPDAERLMGTTVERYGRIDVCICNAGIPGKGAMLHETTLENFTNVLSVNLHGVFLCCKHAIPYMMKQVMLLLLPPPPPPPPPLLLLLLSPSY
jgi:hypothetical protein